MMALITTRDFTFHTFRELNDNQITSLVSGTFTGLSFLQFLWVMHQCVPFVSMAVYTDLIRVALLISFKCCACLPSYYCTCCQGVFNPTCCCFEYSLSPFMFRTLFDNQITSLADGSFTGLPSLQELCVAEYHCLCLCVMMWSNTYFSSCIISVFCVLWTSLFSFTILYYIIIMCILVWPLHVIMIISLNLALVISLFTR